ncbi:MAG: caspase family protein, partial [Pseudomonadota bacterium]
RLVPSNTYAVITGVLGWQDSSLTSYGTENRKDAELARTLRGLGVPESNIAVLLDRQATREAILRTIERVAKEATPDSLFIFYYAGHGMNRAGKGIFFANYDIDTKNAEHTGLSSQDIFEAIKRNFKGKIVLLMADCCYSGMLQAVAENLTKAGIQSSAITSAARSNASTSNWTFSQTVIESFKGSPLADRKGDGGVTLDDMAQEVRDAMKFREKQMSGRYIPPSLETFVIADAQKKKAAADCGKFQTGEYVSDKDGAIARIVDCPSGKYILEYLSYSDRHLKTSPTGNLSKIEYQTYPAGVDVTVMWGGKPYGAKILKVADGFHYVTYPGWDSSWDEWVMSNRIVGN